uniref:Uncharacterized protein n=1 Tax=Panagrolaimus sp. ES5 TaxID=591445 RepID=A0AC34F213_9BILA
MQSKMLFAILFLMTLSINDVGAAAGAYATCQAACFAVLIGGGATPPASVGYAYCQSYCSYLLWIPFF